jgi:ubiquinone/menaquinone biosynthesis C-methylase UbiE
MKQDMTSRGEQDFVSFPSFAAQLYDYMMSAESILLLYQEIAADLVSQIEQGRLLDIGTGPGRLLYEIYELNPEIELHGLDISPSMIRIAKVNLSTIPVDLRLGNIRATDYPNDYFDLVTCSGSFYLWDYPVDGLNELYRILKSGCSAYLYETQNDIDQQRLRKKIRENLQSENLVRRLFSPIFLIKQLRMAYSENEIRTIIDKTKFSGSFSFERVELAGLPIWLCIALKKCV